MGMLLGGLLILIALILGAVQHFGVYNIYGSEDYKWYFYGLVAVIGLIGIILAAWPLMKTEQPKKPAEEPDTHKP
jgi:Na+/melibiose symporter-like transporter